MTRQEVIFEQRLRLALTIVYFCLATAGYADSKTGSANFNQKLSQKRAETVKAELVKMGVKESNIEVVAAGGVNTLAPYSYNRRATVEIK